MEGPMKQKLKIRNINSITVLKLMPIQNLELSDRLVVVFNTIYQKENKKNVYFSNFFFHWLEIEEIKKMFDKTFFTPLKILTPCNQN